MRAARRLFVKHGFHNTSIPAVVAEAGVSIGAIYSYFPTKEALARQIHEDSLARFLALFQKQLEGRETCAAKLRAFAEVVLDTTERDPELMEYLLFMRHEEFMPGLAPICFTSPFQMIQQFVREGVESGELRSGNWRVSGIAYTGIILRAAQLRLECILTEPLTDIADELIATAWSAIRV